MNILGVHGVLLQPSPTHSHPKSFPQNPKLYLSSCPTHSPSLFSCPLISLAKFNIKSGGAKSSAVEAPIWPAEEEEENSDADDLSPNGVVYWKTLRLVECSMFAALGGLAYILSSSLAIENYFGCFFALPIVFSSMRWDVVAGRKTMVATATLLLVLSGPIKSLTYLLMHGFLGLAMGSLWRLRTSWGISIFVAALVRAMGAMGYVVIYSFLIRENILALITINIHASVTYILTSLGYCVIPSMEVIYAIFGSLTRNEEFVEIAKMAGECNLEKRQGGGCSQFVPEFSSTSCRCQCLIMYRYRKDHLCRDLNC